MHFSKFVFGLLFFMVISINAKDHVIYAIVQQVPMGVQNEKIQKNYYINAGTQQGIYPGVILEVLRTISITDPFNSDRRNLHQVKIGEIEIIHSEDQSAIANLKAIYLDEKTPKFDIESFIIGDKVQIALKK